MDSLRFTDHFWSVRLRVATSHYPCRLGISLLSFDFNDLINDWINSLQMTTTMFLYVTWMIWGRSVTWAYADLLLT